MHARKLADWQIQVVLSLKARSEALGEQRATLEANAKAQAEAVKQTIDGWVAAAGLPAGTYGIQEMGEVMLLAEMAQGETGEHDRNLATPATDAGLAAVVVDGQGRELAQTD